MANKEVQALQGIDTLLYARLLENEDKEDGQLIPYQTSLSFDPQIVLQPNLVTLQLLLLLKLILKLNL